ncbi:Uncharacterised protein [BD1-7 clade bacterium]|uniref:ABM domain-containing protein n=1 Tax=BD1-7 clade bacterium TaxID=2029982 RepID=A0A5S9PI48_9GAMM|nr:Uncharacterised protein [BD1-7 clade bacterium]
MIIEHVTYKALPNTSTDDLQQANEAINTFLKRQPGFIYRSNSQDEGLYYDVAYWASEEAAKGASEAFMQSEEGQRLIALTEEGSVSMRHMLVLTDAMQCETADAAS